MNKSAPHAGTLPSRVRRRTRGARRVTAMAFVVLSVPMLGALYHRLVPPEPVPEPVPDSSVSVAAGGFLDPLIRRFTREEAVSIRIDADRRMVVESPPDAEAAPPGDWVVLDHRWFGTPARARGRATRYVGAVMSEDRHVAITPPFVVLTRGPESILLRMEAGRTVSVDAPMPEWVRSDPASGMLVARFDGFGDAAIGDGTVRLQRRFLAW